MKEPSTFGPPKGRVINMKVTLDRFYEACEFDKEKAIPTPEKYKKLSMSDILEKL